jgi:hypothetical protein
MRLLGIAPITEFRIPKPEEVYEPSYTDRDSTRTAPSSSPAADHWGMREWPVPSGFVLAASRNALRRHRPDYAVTGLHLGLKG